MRKRQAKKIVQNLDSYEYTQGSHYSYAITVGGMQYKSSTVLKALQTLARAGLLRMKVINY